MFEGAVPILRAGRSHQSYWDLNRRTKHHTDILQGQRIISGKASLCSEAGGKAKLIKLLQSSNDKKLSSEHSTAVLEVVRAMAVDEVFRLAFRGSDGLTVTINILGSSESQVSFI